MKLLLDENISYRVQRSVQEVFPGTCHVSAIQGLKGDKAIWEHARAHDLVLVTFDHDFVQLAALYGFPPKVLLLTLRNPRYAAIASLLIPFRNRRPSIDVPLFFRRPIRRGRSVAVPTVRSLRRRHAEKEQADRMVFYCEMV